MSGEYQIIDEPKPSSLNWLIIDPILILFASLIIPIFIDLPALGQFWMPLAWITINGFLLGSPTKFRELLIAICTFLLMIVVLYQLVVLGDSDPERAQSAYPYFKIVLQGILFFGLYVIIFKQSSSYQIHEYIKNQQQ